MKIQNKETLELNRQFIDFPVQVTTWRGYGIVRDVKDEDTFLVENKHREVKEVDKFYLRSLTRFEIENYFEPIFRIPPGLT